jgi:hypothetical protein
LEWWLQLLVLLLVWVSGGAALVGVFTVVHLVGALAAIAVHVAISVAVVSMMCILPKSRVILASMMLVLAGLTVFRSPRLMVHMVEVLRMKSLL